MNTITGTADELATTLTQLAELLARKRLGTARDLLARTLPVHPDSPQLLQYQAWVEWMDDELDDALETTQRVLEMDPESFDGQFLRCRIHAEQENYIEAERSILALLANYPDDTSLCAYYAHIMLETFHIDKAEQLAAEALRRDPENEDALNVHVLCGFIARPGDEQRARFQELLQNHPDQLRTTIRLVQMLNDQGKNRQAYELARELVREYPNNQHIVGMASELRFASHWSLLPLWPMQKWGWAGSLGMWLGLIVLVRSEVLVGTPFEFWTLPIIVGYLVYVVYSWAWPPLLRRLLK